MADNLKLDRMLARRLLGVSAIKLQPDSPFVWRTGWNSPIYTDNRLVLSYPHLRNFIKIELARTIIENFEDVEVIATVATGAIAIGAIVADVMGLPFVYVRSHPKDHGLENVIEGNIKPGQKVVVLEDTVTTGANLVKAVEDVTFAGGDVIGMTSIINYGFPMAEARIASTKLKLISLTNYRAIIDEASATKFINKSDVSELERWHADPASWTNDDEV